MSDSPRFSHTLSRRSFVQLISALTATPSLARGAMAQDTAANASSRLWYRRPAERWVEALPIGNGRLGAMVFGGVVTERLQLNDDSLWSGGPKDWNNPMVYEKHGCPSPAPTLVHCHPWLSMFASNVRSYSFEDSVRGICGA